jgi:hypothetical protein
MEPASEPTRCLNNTSESSVGHNKTTGTNGFPSHNIQRTHGLPQPRRRHHSTYS